jgi:inosine/xanthosine triphosphatase
MRDMMRIAVGSTNPVKGRAAEAVLTPLYPEAVYVRLAVPSGVRPQPWGDHETRTGALQRAQTALRQTGAELGIGFEGGIVRTEFGLMLTNWAAVASSDGKIGVGCGGGLLLPAEVTRMIEEGEELGPAMDALTNSRNTKHGDGAIGILTANLVNRQAAFEYTLKLALAPFRSPQFYSKTSAASVRGNDA